ncbi:MAG: PAS domain S-box protein [Bacteroidales bacterium]|nr:PAS domain S-box protein [Bacteroidales bacterium]
MELFNDKTKEQLIKEIEILQKRIEVFERTEDELLLSDQILRQMPDAVLLTDRSGIITRWMGKASEIFGYSEKEAIGNTVDFLRKPDIRDKKSKEIFDSLKMSGSYNGEISSVTKDNKEIPIELTVQTLYNEKMGPLGFIGIGRDLTKQKKRDKLINDLRKKEIKTHERLLQSFIDLQNSQKASLNLMEDLSLEIEERKKAQVELTEKHELLCLLIDNMPDYIYVKDLNCCYLLNNKAHLQHMKVKNQEEALGKNDFDVYEAELASEHNNNDKKVISTGKSLINIEEFYQNRKRDPQWLLTTKVPMRDNSGNITGLVGISRDITARKQAENSLFQSEEKFKILFESSPDAYYLQDLKGIFVDGNKAAEKLTGFKRSELIGQNLQSAGLLDKNQIPKVLKLLGRHVLGKSTGPDEFQLIRKDGKKLTIEIIAHPLKIQNEKLILGIARNITERKITENKLKISENKLRKLAQHLQTVREMERTYIAREIHDELGQLTTALKMDIVWLKNKFAEDRPELLNKLLSMSELTDITNETIRRISSELRPGIIDDLGLIPAIEWQVKDFQSRTGIRCDLELKTGELMIDPERTTAIYRILQESLTNVARHSSASEVKISLLQRKRQLFMQISDNGKGLPANRIEHPKSFGLMGIRERVTIFGGSAVFAGEKGKGTTVKVTIPL